LMKTVVIGRHIAPAILTRLPVVANKTRLHGRGLRILEGRVKVADAELVILASHWTSRVGGEKKTDVQRDKYADQIYGAFKALYTSNPKVDFLVCGDFNDDPTDESVTDHLHATADLEKVLKGGDEPSLYNPFAGERFKGKGTHYDRGRWHLFDQIVLSPGLLDDEGWSFVRGSEHIVVTPSHPTNRKLAGRPWRFGGPSDKAARGYSDHSRVGVELTVRAR